MADNRLYTVVIVSLLFVHNVAIVYAISGDSKGFETRSKEYEILTGISNCTHCLFSHFVIAA